MGNLSYLHLAASNVEPIQPCDAIQREKQYGAVTHAFDRMTPEQLITLPTARSAGIVSRLEPGSTGGLAAVIGITAAGGEAVTPPASSLASDILALEHRAFEQGDVHLATTLRRERLGMSRRTDTAPQPVDLWQRHEAPDLPRDCLPVSIERFAFEQGELMGADPAGLAMSALAVCAAAIPDSIELQVKQHDPSWRENARLWVGLVGMPSTKKSPVMRAAMRPLRAIDQDMASRNAIAVQAWGAVPKKEQSEPQPKQPRLVVQDSTIEALQETLKDSPLGVLSFQDELTGWFGAMEKYAGGKGAKADRGFWLQAFNGGPYAVNRIARGTLLIPNLGVGMLGGIQPEPLRAIASDMDDDGLLQRFLPVILRPATVGIDAPAGEGVGAYECLVERLHRLQPPCGAGNLAKGGPVAMSAEARACREVLEAEHVELVRALEIASPKLAGHLGKADGIFARLCLLWACIEADGLTAPAEISGDVAKRVARFVREFLRPSAVAFYAGVLGMSAGHDDLMSIANLIVSEGLTEVDARIVQRSGQRFRSIAADEVRRLCEKLEAFGWLAPTPVPKGGSPKWCVAPAVHDIFADRGREEAERRAKVREVIAGTLGGK